MCTQLEHDEWLPDLVILGDITTKQNELKLELPGKQNCSSSDHFCQRLQTDIEASVFPTLEERAQGLSKFNMCIGRTGRMFKKIISPTDVWKVSQHLNERSVAYLDPRAFLLLVVKVKCKQHQAYLKASVCGTYKDVDLSLSVQADWARKSVEDSVGMLPNLGPILLFPQNYGPHVLTR